VDVIILLHYVRAVSYSLLEEEIMGNWVMET